LGVNRSDREADHSPPTKAVVKIVWSCTSTHSYVFMAWYLVKLGESFNFYYCMKNLQRLAVVSDFFFLFSSHRVWPRPFPSTSFTIIFSIDVT